MDGNIENMQSLTGRIKALAIDTTLTKKGMCAEAKAVGEALATKVNITDIVDDLTSVATDKPLSANQGRLLKKQIDEIDPHYAENVLYNDTNVKDALDKVSKAENIAYDGEKSVQGAIDELKSLVCNVEKIEMIETMTTPTTETRYYTYTATKKCIINLTFTACFGNTGAKVISIYRNSDTVASSYNYDGASLTATINMILEKGDQIKCNAAYTKEADNGIRAIGYVQYLE